MIIIIRENGDLVNNSNYRIILRSYDKTLKPTGKIDCKNYDVFKEFSDVVSLILNEKNKKGE